MSWAEATRLVIARELYESLRRKAIWIVAAILVLGSTAAVVLPEILGGDSDSREIGLVGAPSDEFGNTLAQIAAGVDIEIELVDFDGRDAATTAVRDGDVDAAAVLDTDPLGIVMPTDDDAQLEALLRQAIGTTSVVDSLADAGLTPEEVEAAFDTAEPTVVVLDTERGGRRAAAFAISIVLYIMLLLLTSQVASGVAIEKTNSVSEVLLAIVRPHALLFGKVIGVGSIGIFTLACGALPVLVKLAAGGSLPPGIGGTLAGGAAFFAIGVALYLTTGGALGALVGRQEEAAAAVAPLSVMLIAFYIVGQGGADTTLGGILAYVPFAAPMVMPGRIALGASSPFEIAASLTIGVVTVLVVGRVSAAVYRRAIVRTGRRLKLRDALRPLPR
ncbi:MAG TPA: ABC transporter permease [Ilumatobacteraceae bacterium]|nr:ABC transporter permease [Ilumatobacteraceae bacterium]